MTNNTMTAVSGLPMQDEQLRIVVVDDEVVTCSMVRLILTKQGHIVETFLDSVKALERLRTNPPDLLITDLSMPQISGLTLIREVLAMHPSIAIIVISVDSRSGTIGECRKIAPLDFIAKPFTSDVLLLSVANALEKVHLRKQVAYLQETRPNSQSLPEAESATKTPITETSTPVVQELHTSIATIEHVPMIAIAIGHDMRIQGYSGLTHAYAQQRGLDLPPIHTPAVQLQRHAGEHSVLHYLHQAVAKSHNQLPRHSFFEEQNNTYSCDIVAMPNGYLATAYLLPQQQQTQQQSTQIEDVQKTLSDTEERLSLLLRTAPFGIVELTYQPASSNSDATFTIECNDALIRILRHNDRTAEYMQVNALPQTLIFLQDSLELLYQGSEQVLTKETEYLAPDRETVYVRYQLAALPSDRNGKHFLCIVEDITTQHIAKQQIIESEARHRLIFEKAPIAIMETISLGIKNQPNIYVNEAFTRITGYTLDEFLEVPAEEMNHPEDIAKEKMLMQEIAERKIDSYTMQQRIVHKDRSLRWVELYTNVIRNPLDGNTERLITIFHDITERKEAEAEIQRQQELLEHQTLEIETINVGLQEQNTALQQMNQELERLNEEKSEFIGIASHDLRNPLTSIIMKSETLLNYFDKYSKEQILSSTDFILQTAQRMNEIIKNFLDLYAIEQGTISIDNTRFDLGEMLEQVIEEYNPRASAKNIIIHYEELSPTAQLVSDKVLVRQIVDNLISNAVKYTLQRKNIYVRLKAITSHTYRSSQTGIAQVQDSVIALRIEVQDEGEGILAHQIPVVFERFAHIGTKPTGGETTTGLGLSIVRRLAQLIGAHVWCESEFQQGSTFFLEIPVQAQ